MLSGAAGPKGGPQGILWARGQLSSGVNRKFLENNLLPLLPVGVTFVSGQLSEERRPCVLQGEGTPWGSQALEGWVGLGELPTWGKREPSL